MRRRRFPLSATVLTLTLLTTSSLAADPLAILWDDSHDTDGDELTGQYTELAAFALTAGHSVTELEGPVGTITAAALAGYDVLMVFDAESAFTLDERTAIDAFIAGGGKLLVAGDRPASFNRSSHNTLLAPYGLTFTAVDLLDGTNTNPAFDLSVWNVDALTAGLTVVDFFSSGTLAVNAAVAGTKVLGSTSPTGHVGFAYGAAGAVIVVTDGDVFSDSQLSPGDQEEKLLENILGYFAAPPEPSGPAAPIEITIDIKPDGVPNPVNPKSKGVVPVAILTTSVADGDALDFDPWEAIDVTTLALGPALAPPDHEPTAEDVDFDGDLDMMLKFRTQEIGLECGDTELSLTAQTFEEQTVIGTDSIETPGCQKDKKK